MITDYEYERYFYTGSHRKCLLFVEQDANVTIVAGRPPQITKTGGTPLIITNDNILQEKFELQENFNSSENWAFGSVEPSAISFDIREDGSIPILRDQLLRLYLYFDDNSSTLLYVGTYYIDEDELSDDSKSRTISGYDMIQSIRDVDIIDMYRGLFNAHQEPDPEDPEQKIWVPAREKITVKEARDALFAYLADKENGEGLPILQEEVELPNDTFEFAFDVDTEALSGGQFLEDICEINGRYGHLGRKISQESETKNYQIFQYIRVERYDEAGEKIGNELRMQGMMKGLYQTLSIGKIRVYNRDSVRLAGYDEGYYKTKMSTYNIYDNILIDDLTKSKTQEQVLKAMMKNIYDSVRYRKYVPFNAKFPADLCREVGDRITLYSDIDLQIDEDNPRSFKTLIFQRRITGIQNMVDEYSAQGDKKLPAFGDYSSSSGYSGKTTRTGKSGSSTTYGPDGTVEKSYVTKEDLVELFRNIQIRLLDEPTDVSVTYSEGGTIPAHTIHYRPIAEQIYWDTNLHIQDGDTTNPITIEDVSYNVEPYQWVYYTWSVPNPSTGDDDYYSRLCIYGEDNVWHVTKNETPIANTNDGDVIAQELHEGSTYSVLTINGVNVTVNYGDIIIKSDYYANEPMSYVYPGVWIDFGPGYGSSGPYLYDVNAGEIVSENAVNISWTDPENISTNKPVPATWDGTVVVRNTDHEPRHPWDGTQIVNSKTRDRYSETPFKDLNLPAEKKLYYGIFPYDTEGNCRYTKVVVVNIQDDDKSPVINSITVSDLTATINYRIPSGTYTGMYATIKKGSIPLSKDDGIKKSISDQSLTSVVFDNLLGRSEYWAVIYAETANGQLSSEPVSFKTGNAWGGEEITILWSGQQNKMTVKLDNSHLVFTLYSGELVTYSFNAYAGTTVADVDNIYVHFLLDSEQQLAKPSMIYYNGSTYSYNQEEPTDEQMAAIYTWLSAGLN